MRMFLLDCGTIQIPRFNIIQDEESRKNPAALMTVPVQAFLIEQKDGLILFDSGCDPGGIDGNWPEEYRKIPFKGTHLPQRLEAMGVKPDDIRHVVVSHLHFDHAGCLMLFKKARFIVSEVELERTLHAYQNKLDMNAHLASDVENWSAAGLAWEKVAPDTRTLKLADGITIHNLGAGHSWGMLGLMVELPSSGNQFLISDAMYTRKNHGPPEILPGLLLDTEGYRQSVKYIESHASTRNAAIIYGHDMAQFKVLLEKTRGGMK